MDSREFFELMGEMVKAKKELTEAVEKGKQDMLIELMEQAGSNESLLDLIRLFFRCGCPANVMIKVFMEIAKQKGAQSFDWNEAMRKEFTDDNEGGGND